MFFYPTPYLRLFTPSQLFQDMPIKLKTTFTLGCSVSRIELFGEFNCLFSTFKQATENGGNMLEERSSISLLNRLCSALKETTSTFEKALNVSKDGSSVTRDGSILRSISLGVRRDRNIEVLRSGCERSLLFWVPFRADRGLHVVRRGCQQSCRLVR